MEPSKLIERARTAWQNWLRRRTAHLWNPQFDQLLRMYSQVQDAYYRESSEVRRLRAKLELGSTWLHENVVPQSLGTPAYTSARAFADWLVWKADRRTTAGMVHPFARWCVEPRPEDVE